MSTCLRLQFLLPTQHIEIFDVFFKIELVLLPINIVIMSIAMKVVNKIRAHMNLLQVIKSFILNYIICCFCRIITVLYQMRILTFEGKVQHNFVIMACSFVRTYFFSTILTGISIVFIERLAATYFIADYEKKKRLYIPFCLISYNFFLSVIAAEFFTYEILPMWFLVGAGVISTLFGALGFVVIYRQNSIRLAKINKNHRSTRLSYTLSLRFQLEENVRSMKLLRTAFLLLSLQNVPYAALYVIGNMDLIRNLKDGWISQLLETLFNVLVATDGVIIALVVFVTDPTYVLVVKNLKYIGWLAPTFHVNLDEVVPPEKNESNIYFVNMTEMWDSHLKEVEIAREKQTRPKTRKKSRRRATIHTEHGE